MKPESVTLAYIGLGGNVGNSLELLALARKAIVASAGIRELAFSSLYRSQPMGPTDQPEFINAVMAVETSLSAHSLLKVLQTIELAHGRVRSSLRWGPRTLDLDLLIYGDEIIAEETLTLPHPGIADREFVLHPLAEIAPPDLDIPGMGRLSDLVMACPRHSLEPVRHG